VSDAIRVVVSGVDVATGTITLASEWVAVGARWSKRYKRRARLARKRRRGWA